ncbi:MAG TPA: lysophospholipid acyltransferase family protein [Gemmatimonadaceae bacterium]|nr:lysophospholipid acyltransferase family protein [Gemmatimonadaceae bacterium]
MRIVQTAPWSGDAQYVFYANHTSHLDFIVLWSALPPGLRARTRPVAGRDYWDRGPVRRYLAREVFNAILIDRPVPGAPHDPESRARGQIERIAAEMGDSFSVIVFPEGTRGSGEGILPFKSGMYHLCRLRPDVVPVPVFLDNFNRVLPKGELVPVPMLSRAVFGAPVPLADGETKAQFLGRAREVLVELGRA